MDCLFNWDFPEFFSEFQKTINNPSIKFAWVKIKLILKN